MNEENKRIMCKSRKHDQQEGKSKKFQQLQAWTRGARIILLTKTNDLRKSIKKSR